MIRKSRRGPSVNRPDYGEIGVGGTCVEPWAAAVPVAVCWPQCSPVLNAPAHKPTLEAVLASPGTWGSLSAEEVLGTVQEL